MGLWQLAWKTAWFFRRTNAAVMLGVSTAAAVLTGALLVGDSVRGSLRALALDRLGRFEAALVSDYFFRHALADEFAAAIRQQPDGAEVEPAILLLGSTVELRTGQRIRRSTQVTTLGVQQSFWQRDVRPWNIPPLGKDQVILNRRLAEELDARIGDEITLRLPTASQVPADSTLAQKANRVRSIPRLKVTAIIDDRGLGRFSLQQNQSLPRNVFINLSALQEELQLADKINAILVARQPAQNSMQAPADHPIDYNLSLHPQLADLGLRLQRVRREFMPAEGPTQTIYDYWQLTSDRLLIPPGVVEALSDVMTRYQGQAVMTYLADSIRLAEPRASGAIEIPYSLITGIDNTASFPLLSPGESLADNEIVLNSWAAERLQAQKGDVVVVEYFEPETAHGTPRRSSQQFTVRAVVPLTEPETPYRRNRPPQFSSPPTVFNDPDLTPTVEGITDQETIENWDAPFPFDIRRVQRADDQYWQNHRTTPKAFVTLRTAQRLWGSRFGNVTAIRFAASPAVTDQTLTAAVVEALERNQVVSKLGLVFQPIRQQALAASQGTTPFDVLFLALSSFLMLAAILLVVLLFRLGLEWRADQLGLLVAFGWTGQRATRVWLVEGVLVTAVGAAVGLSIGVAYCRIIIAGLNSPRWWLGAVSTPFLRLHVSGSSFLLGYLLSLLVCGLSISGATWGLSRLPPRRLLAGQLTSLDVIGRTSRFTGALILLFLLSALLVGGAALWLEGEARGGAFVGAGFLLLCGLLLGLWQWLRSRGQSSQLTLMRLAATTAARHPTRSVLTIGLMASATFLIISLSAFRVEPSLQGCGGFRLVGEASLPIFEPLSVHRSHSGKEDTPNTTGIDQQGSAPSGPRPPSSPLVFSLRLKAGDDASCRNLYKVSRPRVLGVPRAWAERYDSRDIPAFPFAAFQRDAPDGKPVTNPWHLLWQDFDGVTPVILDINTAVYSLRWTGGVGSDHTVEFPSGRRVTFRIVALLSNSLLQGQLLISESHFTRLFPEVSGYQYFLIDVPAEAAQDWRAYWEDRYADQGLALRPTERVLSELLAVQNTYLSTFQTLGALGVLLGTLGVAVVQMRSVLERRQELAVFRAMGFRRLRLARMVLMENLTLLLAGLGVGSMAAVAAILPYVVLGGATIPWFQILLLLAAILIAGAASSLMTVQFTLRAPLLAAIRGE